MRQVATNDELKQAMKAAEPEILVTAPELSKKVRTWHIIRRVANILVFVILGLAIFAWANPLEFEFLATPGARLARQIVLGVGLLLLFSEYLMPVVKTYNVKGQDDTGLKLVHRKKR